MDIYQKSVIKIGGYLLKASMLRWYGSQVDLIPSRSIPLETILPLCEIPNVNMVSIQKGSGMFDYRRNPDVKSILPSLGERIRNFSDTSRHSISSGLVDIYRYSTHSHGWCVRYSNMGATSFLWRLALV